jgi:hypothetical protein
VNTDAGDVLSERDEDNNTLGGTMITVQDVPLLVAGTPASVNTVAGQYVYFRYVAQSGRDLHFTADVDVPGRISFYARFGSLPTRTSFDQTYPTQDSHQELQVNPSVAGTHYVLFYNSSGNNARVTLTVTEVLPPTPTPTVTASETPTPTITETPAVETL